MVYVIQVCWQLKPLLHIPLLCVQWKTPDDGQRNCPKHIEFYSKNKLETLVYLFGFIIRIFHVEWSPERQILLTHPVVRSWTLLVMFQVQWINVESVYNVRWVFQPVKRQTTNAGYVKLTTQHKSIRWIQSHAPSILATKTDWLVMCTVIINSYCESNFLFLQGTIDNGSGPPHYRGFTITLRHTTLGRIHVYEWSARRRDLNLTTHNTQKSKTSMPPVGFEPAIPGHVRPQTHTIDWAATGISSDNHIGRINKMYGENTNFAKLRKVTIS